MSRVVYTNIPDAPEQEGLRAAHQVRLVAPAEEGTGIKQLPVGVYGFTYSPGLDSAPLFGMVAPAAVPPAIIARLTEAAAGAVKSDALNARLIEIGYLPVGSSPAEFRARIEAEIDKWTRIIQTANIKPT